MPATKVQLTGGGFQDSEGNVLALGYLEMVLSQDGAIAGVGQVASGITIRVTLNSSGNVDTSSPQSVWGNDQLLPVNSYYRVTGYTAAGQPAWGPNNQQVNGSGGTFDVGTWVPNQVFSWTPPLFTPLLETNGVPNGSQLKLNLHSNDASIILTDDGTGDVNLAVATITLPVTVPTMYENLIQYHMDSQGVTLSMTGTGAAVVNAPSTATLVPTATEGYTLSISTPSGANAIPYLWAESTGHVTLGNMVSYVCRQSFNQLTSVRYWLGLCDDPNSGNPFFSDDPNANFIGFRYSTSAGDASIKCICQAGLTQTIVSTGILDTNFHNFEIRYAASVVTFYIDGNLVATITTHIPSASLLLKWFSEVDNLNVGNLRSFTWESSKILNIR